MSDYKSLIISKQVEEALQVAAARLIGQGQLSLEEDTDYASYTYNHHLYGKQVLSLSAIHENWTVVSFAGHDLFLELIGSKGWTSSAESVIEFFAATGHPVELGASLVQLELGAEVDEQFAVLVNDGEELRLESLSPLLAALSKGRLELARTAFETGKVEVTSTTEEAVLDIPASAEGEPEAQPEVDVAASETETVADELGTAPEGRATRLRKWICSPRGLTICAVGLLAVGGIAMAAVSLSKE